MTQRILLLDDDPSFRQDLERELVRLGHAPESFDCWSDALDYIEGDDPLDILVTELGLKAGPNGVSFARIARRHRPYMRLVFVTGREDLAEGVDPDLGPVMLKAIGPQAVAQALV
jgi:ActR/RegA family two-component response regulator